VVTRRTCDCADCADVGVWWLRIQLPQRRAPETLLVCQQHMEAIQQAHSAGHLQILTPPRSASTRRQAPRRSVGIG
jgi:hypothetical protein